MTSLIFLWTVYVKTPDNIAVIFMNSAEAVYKERRISEHVPFA
jgi:hypothetical protein